MLNGFLTCFLKVLTFYHFNFDKFLFYTFIFKRFPFKRLIFLQSQLQLYICILHAVLNSFAILILLAPIFLPRPIG